MTRRGVQPSLLRSSQSKGYSRVQMRAALSIHSCISGASETSTTNSTGYLNTVTAGSESTVISRTTSGCLRSSVGLMRTA